MDRAAEIQSLVERLRDHEGVRDAWTAKSFTDRLIVVETATEDPPAAVFDLLADHDCLPVGEVYDDAAEGPTDAFAGAVESGRRYRFVDADSRGELQSYVVD